MHLNLAKEYLITRGVQPHLDPRPRDFWPMAMGLSGPKWAYIFFVSLAWKCDETINFKLLLRKKFSKKKFHSDFRDLENFYTAKKCFSFIGL